MSQKLKSNAQICSVSKDFNLTSNICSSKTKIILKYTMLQLCTLFICKQLSHFSILCLLRNLRRNIQEQAEETENTQAFICVFSGCKIYDLGIFSAMLEQNYRNTVSSDTHVWLNVNFRAVSGLFISLASG